SYAKIRFDDQSLKTVVSHLRDIEDPLARALVWGAVWDMTRAAQMSAKTFIDIVLKNIDIETNSTMMRALSNQLQTASSIYMPLSHRKETVAAVTSALWQIAGGAEPGYEEQYQFVTTFASLVSDSSNANIVNDILD